MKYFSICAFCLSIGISAIVFGCDNAEDSSVDVDSDNDTDSDSDTDTDTDTDSDTDTGADDECGPYPEYSEDMWDLFAVVPNTQFKAYYDRDGDGEPEETVMRMYEDVYCKRDSIKSLVLAVGSLCSDCSICLPCAADFVSLANRQEDIHLANGELVGLYYFDVPAEIMLPCEETSETLTSFGWTGGWRIEDTNLDIFFSYGDGGGVEARFLRRFPIIYIIETATMKVVAGEKGDEYDPAGEGWELDVLSEVQAINNAD